MGSVRDRRESEGSGEVLCPPEGSASTERLKKIWIEEGIKKGVQQGVRLGIQQGVQQGVQQNRIKTILSLAQRSFTPEQIADLLSLDLEEVERVLAQH